MIDGGSDEEEPMLLDHMSSPFLAKFLCGKGSFTLCLADIHYKFNTPLDLFSSIMDSNIFKPLDYDSLHDLQKGILTGIKN
jgi:hypothetical protein